MDDKGEFPFFFSPSLDDKSIFSFLFPSHRCRTLGCYRPADLCRSGLQILVDNNVFSVQFSSGDEVDRLLFQETLWSCTMVPGSSSTWDLRYLRPWVPVTLGTWGDLGYLRPWVLGTCGTWDLKRPTTPLSYGKFSLMKRSKINEYFSPIKSILFPS